MKRRPFKPLIPARPTGVGYECWFDGACWPNPGGHAGAGALIKRDGVTIHTHAEYLGSGNTTNNVAEYAGLIAVLKYLVANSIHSAIVYGDADLVIKQMNLEWKAGSLTKAERRGDIPIKPRHYLPFYQEAMALRLKLLNVKYAWIPREYNTEADELSTRQLRDRGYRDTWDQRPQSELEMLDEQFSAMCAER